MEKIIIASHKLEWFVSNWQSWTNWSVPFFLWLWASCISCTLFKQMVVVVFNSSTF